MTQLFPQDRAAIAHQIKEAINDYCKVTYDDGHRTHLGASLIGDECKRYLWYVFRWVKRPTFINYKGENHAGRMQRLFNRGHREEARWIEWLRGIGFQVWDTDVDGNQTRISGVEKHYGGSLDGVGIAPPGLQKLAAVGPFLIEYKTYSAKTFAKLLKEGVRKAKPNHWVQMCTYGRYYKFRYAMYCAICKDDDDIHIEIVELDWAVADENYRKAEEVILAVRPPVRYSELPSHFKCKYCDFNDVCFKGAAYEKNCRSCEFATPVKEGQWYCGVNQGVIPKEIIPVGCGQWKPVGRNG